MDFWLFQIIGWTGFVLITCLREFIQTLSSGGDAVTLVNGFLSYFFYGLAGIVLTWLLRFFYRYLYYRQYSFLSVIGFVVPATLIVSIVHLLIICLLNGLFLGWPIIPDLYDYAVSLIYNLPIFFGWSILYFGIKFRNQSVLERDRAEKANLLAQTAQLQMLRYQLNPHFLFNSLNSIWALIDEDKKASKEMVS